MRLPRPAALALLALTALAALPALAQKAPSAAVQAGKLLRQGHRGEAIELLGRAPAQDGEARYLLAALLTEERRAGRVCESDAYRSSIVLRLDEAIAADASLRARALRDGRFAIIHDTLGWQRLLGRSPARVADVPELLSRVTFHGPPQGIFGSSSMLDFLPGGRVQGWKSVWDEKAGRPKHMAISGGYRVEGRKVTVNLGKGEVWSGELNTDGILEITDQGNFRDEPDECDA